MSEAKDEKSFSWVRLVLGLGLWVGGIAAVLITVALSSPTAAEVIRDAFAYLLAFFGTPFILESSVAVIGIIIVITINHYRMQKEGDGWVYLAVPDQDGPGAEGDPPHRLEAVVLKEKLDTLDDIDAKLGAIEGFLDLGLPQEALSHLQSLQAEEQALPKAITLRDQARAAL
jgi:hypothetical protein